MKVKELNRILFELRRKNVTDFFISPNHITYQIWSQLDKLDLIMLASIDDTLKNKIFEFNPDLKLLLNGIINFDEFDTRLGSEQIDAVIKVFNNVCEIKASPRTNNYTPKLLESFARAENLLGLTLSINSSNKFSKAALNINKLIITCDYDREFTEEKDPIFDILYSVDSLVSLKLERGYLSATSIELLANLQLISLEFYNTFIPRANKSLFIQTIHQCSREMIILKFVCLGIYSNIQNMLQIQCHIFDRIDLYAKNLNVITLTISYHYPGCFQGLYRLKYLQKVIIYYNIYMIKNGEYRTLVSFIEKLKVLRQKMENLEISIRLFTHPKDDGDNNYIRYKRYLCHIFIVNTQNIVDDISLIGEPSSFD